MPLSHRPAGAAEDAAARRLDVLRLRRQGKHYREIAATVGCSLATVHRDLKTALTEIAEQDGAEARLLRAQESDMLRGLWAGLAEAALAGDLPAVDRALRIRESFRRLLGLDAPEKLAPTTPDGTAPYAGAGGPLASMSDDELRAYLTRLVDGEPAYPLSDAGAAGDGDGDPE